MKKKYRIKYKYRKKVMDFVFYATSQLDAFKQFIYQAERFKLPLNSSINLNIKLEESENE